MAVDTECDLNTDKATGSDQRVTRAGGVSANQPSPLAAITKAQRYYERMKKSKDNAGRRIKVVSAVCLAFMIIEFTGGYFANSLAIMTDAAHLLSDFAGFMISLVALWLATRPATKTMSFGWYRSEVMGAIMSVLIIWVLTGVLVYLAIHRIVNEDYEIDASIMLVTASIGVIINVVMGVVLHHGHGHSHGGLNHSHGGTKHSKVKSPYKSPTRLVIIEQDSHENVNVRAAFIHIVGDLLQSVGVFIAALLIWFKPSWAIADPICTFIFSVIVLITTLAILKDAFLVLMEGVPKGLSFNDLKAALEDIPGVVAVHDLHIWSLTVGTIALSVHLVIESEECSSQAILEEASAICTERFDIHHNTIQVETQGQKTTECFQCQDPVED